MLSLPNRRRNLFAGVTRQHRKSVAKPYFASLVAWGLFFVTGLLPYIDGMDVIEDTTDQVSNKAPIHTSIEIVALRNRLGSGQDVIYVFRIPFQRSGIIWMSPWNQRSRSLIDL